MTADDAEKADLRPDRLQRLQDCLEEELERHKITKEENSKSKVFVEKIKKQLIQTMADKDQLFSRMYVESKLVGSVEDKLKVGKADEEDIDICLRLPLDDKDAGKITVSESANPLYASCFSCSFPRAAWQWPVPRRLHRRAWRRLFAGAEVQGAGAGAEVQGKEGHGHGHGDDLVFFRADGFRGWIQGLAARSMAELKKTSPDLVADLRQSRSGPAFTLIKDGFVSVDFVTSIAMPAEAAVRFDDQEAIEAKTAQLVKTMDEVNCYLVAAGPRVGLVEEEEDVDVEDVEEGLGRRRRKEVDPEMGEGRRKRKKRRPAAAPPPTLFRGQFRTLEKKALERKACLKNVVRLLKILRDCNSWRPIKSFFLRTLVIRYYNDSKASASAASASADPDLSQKQMAPLFLEVLEELRRCLTQGVSPHWLFARCNLFVRLSPEFRENVANRLQKMLKKLHAALRGANKDTINRHVRLLFNANGKRWDTFDISPQSDELQRACVMLLIHGIVNLSQIEEQPADPTKVTDSAVSADREEVTSGSGSGSPKRSFKESAVAEKISLERLNETLSALLSNEELPQTKRVQIELLSSLFSEALAIEGRTGSAELAEVSSDSPKISLESAEARAVSQDIALSHLKARIKLLSSGEELLPVSVSSQMQDLINQLKRPFASRSTIESETPFSRDGFRRALQCGESVFWAYCFAAASDGIWHGDNGRNLFHQGEDLGFDRAELCLYWNVGLCRKKEPEGTTAAKGPEEHHPDSQLGRGRRWHKCATCQLRRRKQQHPAVECYMLGARADALEGGLVGHAIETRPDASLALSSAKSSTTDEDDDEMKAQ